MEWSGVRWSGVVCGEVSWAGWGVAGVWFHAEWVGLCGVGSLTRLLLKTASNRRVKRSSRRVGKRGDAASKMVGMSAAASHLAWASQYRLPRRTVKAIHIRHTWG